MGIGRPIGDQDPADFVLKPFSKEERKDLGEFIAHGADAINALVLTGIVKLKPLLTLNYLSLPDSSRATGTLNGEHET